MFKPLISLFLAFCILCCLSACGASKIEDTSQNASANSSIDDIKYANIKWENKNNYLLVKSVTKEKDEITQERSYSYNQYGKIQSEQIITFWTTEQLENLLQYSNTSEFISWITRNYFYDDFGNAYKRSTYIRNYTDNTSSEISSEIACDNNGNIISVKTTNSTEPERWEYNYDDCGNETHYRYYINNKIDTSISTHYDENGKETNSDKIIFNYNNRWTEQYEFKYIYTDVDENNVSLKRGYNENGDEIEKVKLLYDNNGNIIKETHYDEGKTTRIVEHQYQLKEEIIKEYKELIEEFENGNQEVSVESEYFTEDESVSSKQESEHIHNFSYSKATCTTPAKCSCGVTSGYENDHDWEAVYETVHYDEEGHYEDVEVFDGSGSKILYECSRCNHQTKTLEEYYKHFDSEHYEFKTWREWYHKRTFNKEWIIDVEEYDEEKFVSYKCTVCGIVDK